KGYIQPFDEYDVTNGKLREHGARLDRFLARWKQLCFSDGEAIRQEGRDGRIGIRPSGLTPRAPASGKPFGPGAFGPNPSGSGSAVSRYDRRQNPRPWDQMPSGRAIPSSQEA